MSCHYTKEVRLPPARLMSHVCLLVVWELLRALVWFSPNVKTLPRSIKLDLWVWANSYFPKSMSSVIQSAALQLTGRPVKSSNLCAFNDSVIL